MYNSIIIDLCMPMVLYKKLKGRKPDLDDLIQLDPTVGKSLKALLECEGFVGCWSDVCK